MLAPVRAALSNFGPPRYDRAGFSIGLCKRPNGNGYANVRNVSTPMPADQDKPLESLGAVTAIDSNALQGLDDLAKLAAQIFDMPMALISVVDIAYRRFEARLGLDIEQAEQMSSLRGRLTSVEDSVFVIEDASSDGRLAGNPLVVGSPHIRFYADAPILAAGGRLLGNVCIVDTKSRSTGAVNLAALLLLASQAGVLLALQIKAAEAEQVARERDAAISHAIEGQRRSKELLELVLRGGDMGLWDLDLQSGKWTINPREREMLGYGSEVESDALDWNALIHPDDLLAQRSAFLDHLQDRTPYAESTYRLHCRDGSWIWVLDRSVIVERDVVGRAKRVVGTHVDVTAQRARDVERVRSNERLEVAVSAGALGLWDLDVSGGRAVYSDRWWALLGYAPDEIQVVEGLWKSLVHPDDESAAREGLSRLLVGKTSVYDGEVRMRHKDGRWLWIHDRANAVERDGTGAARRVIGVSQDISVRKEAEEALKSERHRLQMITDNMPALITQVDRDERYTFVNAHHERVFGIRALSLIGKTMKQICGDAIYGGIAPRIARALSGETVRFEDAGPARGKTVDYESHYIPDRDPSGGVVGFYSMVFDISERKAAEHALVEQQKRLRGITDNLPVLIAELDHEARFTFCNATYRDWLGLDPDTMIGKRIVDAVDPKFYEPRLVQIARAYAGERVVFEQLVDLPIGERWLQTTYIPQMRSDGSVGGMYALTSDISELKDVQKQLDAMAREDALTGLPNRRVFGEHLVNAIARCRRSGSVIAVLYLDIDRFKHINDTGGHAAGDLVLKEFSTRLLRCVRATDTVARHAGDEFVVLLDALDSLDDAGSVASKIVAAMTSNIVALDRPYAVTVSIGVAMHRGDDQTSEALLAAADAALYAAKEAGRNQFRVAPS